MTRFTKKLISALLFLSLAGCIVQSFNPFYTNDLVIDFPAINGEWELTQIGNKKVSEDEKKPWVFSSGTLEIMDENNLKSRLITACFKIENTVFLDTTAADIDKQGNIGLFWAMNVLPVHALLKVRINEDTLTLIPLNYEWFEDNAGKFNIPFVHNKKDAIIMYTATSEQWVSFLKENLDTEGAFNEKDFFYVLKRKTQGKNESSGKN
jgi:hypothetical protein